MLEQSVEIQSFNSVALAVGIPNYRGRKLFNSSIMAVVEWADSKRGAFLKQKAQQFNLDIRSKEHPWNDGIHYSVILAASAQLPFRQTPTVTSVEDYSGEIVPPILHF